MENTICAISTPLGSGGLGVIRISGENAIAVADRVFRAFSGKPLSSMKGYTAAYGAVVDGDETVDEAVAVVFRAPKSYTGENVVELSCHGGLVVLQKSLRLCLSAGADAACPGEFTKRAFLNGKMDLTEAEAVMSIISAKGEAAAKSAVNALEGALSRKIAGINGSLISVCAALAAWVDYPDEDIEDTTESEVLTVVDGALEELAGLLKSFDSGRAVTEGVETAIVGTPNVGKSTVMNLLSGRERSIVTDVPGTTRDVVEDTVRLGNVILRLSDTAGIRDTGDKVEGIGVELARKRLERSDLVLAVFDVSRETTDRDREIAELCRGRNAIALLNKSDLERKFDFGGMESCFKHVIETCAKDGVGLDELTEAVEAVTGARDFDVSKPMLATERQRAGVETAADALREAKTALEAGMTLDAVTVSIDGAVQALLELTGEKASEAIVNKVFEDFCVGK